MTTTQKPKKPLENADAYAAWLKTISPAEREREEKRRYSYTRYVVQLLDEYEDGIECLGEFDTRKEAEQFMDSRKWDEIPEPGYILELEKMTNHFTGGKIVQFAEVQVHDPEETDYAQLRRRYRS